MLEDQCYAIVTDGIPMESLDYKIEKGILTIRFPKGDYKEKRSLVILYPKGHKAPKVLHPASNELAHL